VVVIREARLGDGPAVAAVFGAARALMTYLPQLHTAEEDVEFYRGVVQGGGGAVGSVGGAGKVVEVAEVDGVVVGFSAVRDDWLDHLYVDPSWQGRGIGSELLARAQAARPVGLTLWVFEENTGAQALYARAGFAEVERTDGSGNEERVPDVLMRWPGVGDSGEKRPGAQRTQSGWARSNSGSVE
jgi:ribosomal protein S18 acetylase RimI-like enzyme